MARQTFFSFHYEHDSWRAGQVRNCNVVASEDEHGFIDGVEWETIKSRGDEAVESWIAEQMQYTSVTAVLIGAETAERPWVVHEIVESWNRGNGIVGVRIHNIKDHKGETDFYGRNPLDEIQLPDGSKLSTACKTYDWVLDDGRDNLGTWIEEAFQSRGIRTVGEKIKDSSGITIKAAAGSTSAARRAPTIFAPKAPWSAENDKR